MNQISFWLTTLFTIAALTIFALSPEPSQIFIVVFPAIVFFPIAINKRRKTIDLSVKDALLAYVPFVGRQQLSRLYLSA